MMKQKYSIFSTMEEDIRSVCKTEDEINRTIKLLQEAKEQSEKKEIKIFFFALTDLVEPVLTN